MIQSAALLFRERGVRGTAFADVLEHSGAPRGSVYHHFPGGKQQLAEEATRFAGDFLAAGIVAALQDDDPVAAIGTFASFWIGILRDSDYAAGCPVVAATLDGDEAPGARAAADAAFKRWERLIADAIERHGTTREQARSTATLAIAAIEGAIILSRAQRSAAPLKRVARELTKIATATIGASTP
jgi:AcrR family transcriptional regulator